MATPPRIVDEYKKEFRNIPPPPQSRIVNPKIVASRTYELYMSKSSLDKIMEHCRSYSDQKLEVMGFLMGDVCIWNESVFTLVRDVVTTDLDSTNVSVKFQREGFEGLFSKLEDLPFDYVIVGWYHSHPGLGCFLSSKDLETQRRMFKKPFHTALVLDPINDEIVAYKLKGDEYVEREFAVYAARKNMF
jgi:proteasome lid subunit RPN8/RPN11